MSFGKSKRISRPVYWTDEAIQAIKLLKGQFPQKSMSTLANEAVIYYINTLTVSEVNAINVNNTPHERLLSQLRIANWVKTIRSHYKLTQLQLADALNLSRSTISAIEKGNRNLTMESAKTLLVKFQLPSSAWGYAEGDDDYRKPVDEEEARKLFSKLHLAPLTLTIKHPNELKHKDWKGIGDGI